MKKGLTFEIGVPCNIHASRTEGEAGTGTEPVRTIPKHLCRNRTATEPPDAGRTHNKNKRFLTGKVVFFHQVGVGVPFLQVLLQQLLAHHSTKRPRKPTKNVVILHDSSDSSRKNTLIQHCYIYMHSIYIYNYIHNYTV